jgi:hypothetical protein
MKRLVLFLALGATALATAASPALAIHPGARGVRVANYHAAARPWHGPYAYTPWGEPVALVVPPTADTVSAWSWGVAQTEIRPLHHQFGRSQPPGAFFGAGSPYLHTPLWPSHTDQFGVYPVRGPWR